MGMNDCRCNVKEGVNSAYSTIPSGGSDDFCYVRPSSTVAGTVRTVRLITKSVRSKSTAYSRGGRVHLLITPLNSSETSTWTCKIFSKLTFQPDTYSEITSNLEEAEGPLVPGSSASIVDECAEVCQSIESARHRSSTGLSGIRAWLSNSTLRSKASAAIADRDSVFSKVRLNRGYGTLSSLQSDMETRPEIGSIIQNRSTSLLAEVASLGDEQHQRRVRKQKSRHASGQLPRSLRHRRRELQRLVDLVRARGGGFGSHFKVEEAERHLGSLKKASHIFGSLIPPDREEDLAVIADSLIGDLRFWCSPSSSTGATRPPSEVAYERGRISSMASRPDMNLYCRPSWTRHIPVVGPIITLCDSQPHPNSLELLEMQEVRLARGVRNHE
ncbi:hypothetical protein QFC24_005547 [Naganishia onofrii]|uniref:Uncharacterized protein n=1 Tax=Naganishia onofrii TaxID=1851511 RepID=A0ACC2X7U5_9TREE|nr:hypothetical protein QFC24_005547 [Naganishia onofrii]